ncbi:MAG: hypothetical protein WBA73_02885, partial [Devosia sp.]
MALFHGLGVQPSLVVGAVNDSLEHEAEVNAERVAAGGQAQLTSAPPPPPPAAPARREGLGGQPSLDELDKTPALPESQQEVTVAPEADVAPEGLDGADMAEIKAGGDGEGGDEAAPPADSGDAGSDEPVQTDRAGLPGAAVGPEGGAAPSDVAGRVANP